MRTALLLTHLAVTLFLTGVIWMVQIVHYPLFGLVGAGSFAGYEAAHSTRMGALLALPWALQGATGLALLAFRPSAIPLWLVLADLGMAGVTVAVTLFISVPQHELLAAGFDPAAHRSLVTTNWLRTLAWTASGGTVLAMLAVVIAKP